jgi:hypothetical protein
VFWRCSGKGMRKGGEVREERGGEGKGKRKEER